MKLKELLKRINKIIPNLSSESYPNILINGENNKNINKVTIALDWITTTIKQSAKLKAGLMLVHHGPPNYDAWESKITKQKIALTHKLGLTVYTLPFCLDYSKYGPNINFCKLLNLKYELLPVIYEGMIIKNAIVRLKGNIKHKYLLEKLREFPSSILTIFGKKKFLYKNVIIAAGGGFSWELIEQTNPDVYISGDINIRALRYAQETDILLIGLTHSSMENFPLRLTAKSLSKYLSIPVKYIEEKEMQLYVL